MFSIFICDIDIKGQFYKVFELCSFIKYLPLGHWFTTSNILANGGESAECIRRFISPKTAVIHDFAVSLIPLTQIVFDYLGELEVLCENIIEHETCAQGKLYNEKTEIKVSRDFPFK